MTKNKIVIAAHGRLAEGLRSAATLIMGDLPHVSTIDAFTEDDFDLAAAAKDCVGSIAEGGALIVLTDMLGGSVNNEFMRHIGREGFYLVTGASLPLLLELVSGLDEIETEAMIRDAVCAASGTVCYCNDALRDFRRQDCTRSSGVGADVAPGEGDTGI